MKKYRFSPGMTRLQGGSVTDLNLQAILIHHNGYGGAHTNEAPAGKSVACLPALLCSWSDECPLGVYGRNWRDGRSTPEPRRRQDRTLRVSETYALPTRNGHARHVSRGQGGWVDLF